MNELLAFEIPLKPHSHDYDLINYNESNQWLDEDKRAIDSIVKDIYNRTDIKGEEYVETTKGKVRIVFDQHPSAPRRKQVVGFLTPKPVVATQSILVPWDSITDSKLQQPKANIAQSSYQVALRNGSIIVIKATRYIQDGDKYYFYQDDTNTSECFALVSEVIAINKT